MRGLRPREAGSLRSRHLFTTGVKARESVHGTETSHLYVARTSAEDADLVCGEGRQIVFVDPDRIAGLDLTAATRAVYLEVLSAV